MARELAQAGYQFSSANSINIGRLVPQVAYYVYAYVKLMERGEIRNGDEINAVVPQEISAIYWRLIMRNRWEFPMENLSAHPMRIKYCLIFSVKAAMTEP